MTFLIAEISNHHFGSLDKAKYLILRAKESGADAVKGQAFVAKDMLQWGTMPLGFYEKCAFTLEQYKELIDYGNDIGTNVFFTILSKDLKDLGKYQKFHKLHAGGFDIASKEEIEEFDSKDCFISVRTIREDIKEIENANILFATPYLSDVNIAQYDRLRDWFGSDIGISHHGISCSKLLLACKEYRVPVIEKHFHLGGDIVYKGELYRDCSHSLVPMNFELLAKELK